ncbi:nucleotidyltransferase domain-containing protein [Methylosinus sp. RM1]|uniref:nucleotidyltransferase domain-containing protein n=1 Tax=Methylosinus sp. RM1 TaxID=2583817 RepID=UPI001408541E|nr:nucleotidyltransferase domain-containing protein [Methylosinus sp. RM1]
MNQVHPNTGPFATEEEELREVVSRLAEALDPLSIWLFGSRASGTHRPDSDFDLLVVTKVEDGEDGRDYDRAYAPICGLGVGCDVIPIRIDDFIDELDDPTSMFAEIVRTGVKVYGRRQGRLVTDRREASKKAPPMCESSNRIFAWAAGDAETPFEYGTSEGDDMGSLLDSLIERRATFPELQTLLQRIEGVYHPVDILLFGSRAKGNVDENSDWDILVILPDDADKSLLDPMLGWETQVNSGVYADVQACYESEFIADLNVANSHAREIIDHAIRLSSS